MRCLFIFMFCLLAGKVNAQPDIKKNIYIADKQCKPINWLGSSIYTMDYMPGVDLFAASYVWNKVSSTSGIDIGLYRIDATTYDTLWSQYYGGSRDDQGTDMILKALPNGHILLAGTTLSYDFDFVSNPYQGSQAVYFIELDTVGTVLRTKMLNSNSGFSGTTLRDVEVDDLGNIYATGDTWQDNMDFAHVANGKDGWILKLDTTLNREWMRFWVGYGSDQPAGIGLIQNGNIAVTGITSDTGTTAMLSHLGKGGGDLYVEAYDPQGVTLWQGRYGGTENEIGWDVRYGDNTDDIYVIGRTESATGDIGYHTANAEINDSNKLENTNIWILKLDTAGNLEYSKAYGSKSFGIYPQWDTQYEAALYYKGELWLAIRSPLGGGDFDSIYDISRNKLMLGTFDDKVNLTAKINFYETSAKYVNSFLEMNGSLYAFGTSKLNTTAPINTFGCDTSVDNISYLMRLEEAPLSTKSIIREPRLDLFSLYPNPVHDNLQIELLEGISTKKKFLLITDANGKRMLKKKIAKRINNIDCSRWPVGSYFIKLQTEEYSQTKLFIKQ